MMVGYKGLCRFLRIHKATVQMSESLSRRGSVCPQWAIEFGEFGINREISRCTPSTYWKGSEILFPPSSIIFRHDKELEFIAQES
jgi:hypothetical protein